MVDHPLRADLARLDLWRLAWESFVREPLGTGPDTFEYTFRKFRTAEMVSRLNHSDVMQGHAHNVILQILSTEGILALAATAYLIGHARRPQTKKEFAVWLSVACLVLNLMVNPTSLEVMAIGAYLFGTLATHRTDAPVFRPIRAILFAPALVALIYFAMELNPRWSRQNPCEVVFAARLAEYVQEVAARIPAKRGDAIAYGENLAKEVVACRPNNASARFIKGAITSFADAIGAPGRHDQAIEEMDSALQLDPQSGSMKAVRSSLDRHRTSR